MEVSLTLFKWLGLRRIYVIRIILTVEDHSSFSSSMKNDYVDQFKYTQHMSMSGCISDEMAIFIISHCPCLLGVVISRNSQVTDHTLQSIAEHCTGLQTLSLSRCRQLADAGLITISEQCTNLIALMMEFSRSITDASIISISENCTGLKGLYLQDTAITEASLIAIAKNCTGLQLLYTSEYKGRLRRLKLCREFDSVLELRAVLLSIFPSLLF